MIDRIGRYKDALNTFFESKYFLLFISALTLLNFSLDIGMWTYIEAGTIVSLMILTKSRFIYLPSIVIFVLGGGLSKMPNFKTFSFVLACIVGAILIICFSYFVWINKKKIASITLSNSFVATTLLLAIGMLLSAFGSVAPLKTLAAIGGFLVNLLVMYLVLLTVKNTDDTKDKLAQSFVSIFYVIFIMVLIHFFRLLADYNVKDLLFDKKLFHLGWDYSNHYCAMMNISFIFACYMLITKWKSLKWYERIFYIFPLVGTLLVSVLLSSRGTLIGLVCSILGAIVYIIIKNRNDKKFVIILTTVTALCVITLATLYFTGALNVFGDKRADGDNQLNGRQELWPVAWRHFKENWFLGTGYGTQRIFILSETEQVVYNYHNYFFQISTVGIVGILLFIVYLANLGWHCIRKIDWYLIAFIAVLATFMVSGFVDTLFFSNKIMPLFSIILCYLELKGKENKLEVYWNTRLNIDTIV